jgi:hypothetical protein
MGAALHLAHVHQPLAPKRKRKRGGPGGGGDDGPFLIVPRDACEACGQHWHHKCWGADILLPDDQRPDCPCPCGDPDDPTGQRMSAAAWADLAQHCPEVVAQAVQGQRIRDGIGIHMCAVDDEERHHAFKEKR